MPYTRTEPYLHYRDTPGDDVPVVAAHGFFMDTDMFEHQAANLTNRVITWDARGHGATPATGPFTYWDAARDFLRVLDECGLDRAVLMGHSQGGFAALRAALLAPERVVALVLIDTEPGACSAADQAGYGQLFDAWAANGPIPELTGPLAGQLIGDPTLAGAWVQKWRDRAEVPIDSAAQCLLTRDSVTERLAEITCPALVIRGSLDAAISAHEAAQLADALPGAEGVTDIVGAAHAPTVSHPDETTRVIAGFLADIYTRIPR